MGKIITSPVKKWPGTVTLAYPIVFPQYMAWKAAVNQAAEAEGNDEGSSAILPGVCACVERWELQGLAPSISPDNFPAAPRQAASKLLAWLIEAITEIIVEEDEVPLS